MTYEYDLPFGTPSRRTETAEPVEAKPEPSPCPRCGASPNGDDPQANGSLVHLLAEICDLQKGLLRHSARQMRQVQEMSDHQFEKALAFQAEHLDKTLAFNAHQVEQTYQRAQQANTWQKWGIAAAAALIILLVVLIFVT